MTSLGEAINEEGEHTIFGIPADIMLVLGIDAILIALRLGGTFKPNQFITIVIITDKNMKLIF